MALGVLGVTLAGASACAAVLTTSGRESATALRGDRYPREPVPSGGINGGSYIVSDSRKPMFYGNRR